MAVAIFDVDGTIVRGRCADLYTRYLYKMGLLNFRLLIGYYFDSLYYLFLIRLNKFNQDIAAQKWFNKVKNLTYVDQANSIAERCFKEKIKPRLNNKVVKLLKEHIKKNHRVILLSASPSYMIKPLAKHLKVKSLYATDFICKNNRFVSIKKPFCFMGGKAEILKKMRIDLSESYAYSDSIHDLPVLEMVKFPVVVNPNRRLKRIALKRNWGIT